MSLLSATQILQIWELGVSQSGLERALTILAVALPEHAREGTGGRADGETADGVALRAR
jgi:hypothetical protein